MSTSYCYLDVNCDLHHTVALSVDIVKTPGIYLVVLQLLPQRLQWLQWLQSSHQPACNKHSMLLDEWKSVKNVKVVWTRVHKAALSVVFGHRAVRSVGRIAARVSCAHACRSHYYHITSLITTFSKLTALTFSFSVNNLVQLLVCKITPLNCDQNYT